MKIHKKHIIIAVFTGLIVSTWLAILNFASNGEIYIASENNKNFYIIDINARDLKKPFFGTSFHLNFNKNQYNYDHYSLGTFFTLDDNPLIQVAQKDNSVLVGISLKRGNIIKKRNGNILKLFFIQKTTTPETSSFSFTRGVFSTYDKGRKDILNFKFNPTAIKN